MERLVGASWRILEIASLTDVTWDQRMTSERLFVEGERELSALRRALSLWTANAFGVDGTREFLVQGGDALDAQLADIEHLQSSHRALVHSAEHAADRHGFFHWEVAFPEIFVGRTPPGFDVVIGNPPYVRIQEMDDPQEVAWLRPSMPDGTPRYLSTVANFDLYVPFVERGFKLVRPVGRFCFIVPNKWLLTEYAQRLRSWLVEGRAVNTIVDFGDNQIFAESGVTNYTCLLFLAAAPQAYIHYVQVLPLADVNAELPQVLASLDSNPATVDEDFPITEFSGTPWSFPVGIARTVLGQAERYGAPLQASVAEIIVGLQTSADDIYHLQVVGQGSAPALVTISARALERVSQELTPTREVERALLKPLVSGASVEPYGRPSRPTVLLFPYRRRGGRMELLSAETMATRYPHTWAYLHEFEDTLRARERGRFDDDAWYRFGRHQNLDKQDRAKLGVPRLVDRLRAFYDPDGTYYLDNVDVNGVLLDQQRPEDPKYFLALLNSSLLDYLFRLRSVRFQNRFFSANKQFIAALPVRRIPFVTPSALRRRERQHGATLARQAMTTGSFEGFAQWVDSRLAPAHPPQRSAAARLDTDAQWQGWSGRQADLWEQADVVHDGLAELAEWRERNTEAAQTERRGFVQWATHLAGDVANTPTGRRRLARAEQLTAADVLALHPRGAGGRPPTRATVASVTAQVEQFQETLSRLSNEQRAVDRLIDIMVFKLYGISGDQARIVLGAAPW